MARVRGPKAGRKPSHRGVPNADPDAHTGGLPSREALRQFIRNSGGRVGKREIAREFGIGADQRGALRDLLRDLAGHGDIAPAGHKRFTQPGRLPDVTVVQVTGTDTDGDPIARPVGWEGEGPPPMVLMLREPRGQPALAPGQRVLARLKPIGGNKYEGRTIKRLAKSRRAYSAYSARRTGWCPPTVAARRNGAYPKARPTARKTARSCWPSRCQAAPTA